MGKILCFVSDELADFEITHAFHKLKTVGKREVVTVGYDFNPVVSESGLTYLPDQTVSRFEVYLVNLDPTNGSEIQKTRPCLVVSPDEMNRWIRTVIVAPMTTGRQTYPTQVACTFEGKQGQIVLDQIRTVDKSRLVRKLGQIDEQAQAEVLAVLAELFAK